MDSCVTDLKDNQFGLETVPGELSPKKIKGWPDIFELIERFLRQLVNGRVSS